MYDIEAFVGRNFQDYEYYGSPTTDLKVSCPFCESNGAGEDTGNHLHIHLHPDKQVVHCFRCGYSRNWVNFVIDITGLPYWQAVGELYVVPRIRSDIKGRFDVRVDDVKKPEHMGLPEDFQPLHKTNIQGSHLALVARKYMAHRGFNMSVCKSYNIGIAESVGYRIIIPIEQGYWQGRSIYKWLQPKYINPKAPARDILFNSQALDLYSEVVICEGAFSAMAVGNNAIALISKEATDERLRRILRSAADTFIIALEAGAYSSMKKLLDALVGSGKRVIVWKYLEGDPADPFNTFVTLDYDMKTRLSLLLE